MALLAFKWNITVYEIGSLIFLPLLSPFNLFSLHFCVIRRKVRKSFFVPLWRCMQKRQLRAAAFST